MAYGTGAALTPDIAAQTVQPSDAMCLQSMLEARAMEVGFGKVRLQL
jgi:hypothetical protein